LRVIGKSIAALALEPTSTSPASELDLARALLAILKDAELVGSSLRRADLAHADLTNAELRCRFARRGPLPGEGRRREAWPRLVVRRGDTLSGADTARLAAGMSKP
jgi:uncharacterized protein YjbI with pentapeptide repeats